MFMELQAYLTYKLQPRLQVLVRAWTGRALLRSRFRLT